MKIAETLGLAVPFLAFTGKVFADSTIINLRPAGGQFGSLADITLPSLISALVVLVLVIAGLVAFGFLVFGGIMWITSGGDKAKTESARNTITAALVGLLIVFAAWAIIQLVQAFFGVSILSLNIVTVTKTGAI